MSALSDLSSSDMGHDPLDEALEQISPELDDDLRPLIAALQAGEPIEDAWEQILREILDEA
jgi:hypothetical protein